MLDVLIALVPATVMGCIYFGTNALFTLAVTLFGSVATEFVWLLCGKKTIKEILKQFDFTSVVTGLLLGLTMPPLAYSYWYVPLLSAVFAVGIVKMMFGGTGRNIVNPAIAGRIFAFIAFSSVMVSGWVFPSVGTVGAVRAGTTIQTGATPLTALLSKGIKAVSLSNLDLFLGTGVRGCIGETCKAALLAGGIYLVIRKVIKWQYPVIYIGLTGLVGVFMDGFDFSVFLPNILSGGLFLGAIFMATDYVTSPNNKWASYVYYVILGVITALLRYGTKIEVVSFAILLANLIVPLLNTYIRPRPFGSKPVFDALKEKIAAKKVLNAQKKAAEEAQKQ
jgi:RnfABCDGE-type electron transport complex D subunit